MPWVGLDAHGYGNRAKSRTIGAGARCGGLALLPALRLRARFGRANACSITPRHTARSASMRAIPLQRGTNAHGNQETCELASRVWYLDNVASAC